MATAPWMKTWLSASPSISAFTSFAGAAPFPAGVPMTKLKEWSSLEETSLSRAGRRIGTGLGKVG